MRFQCHNCYTLVDIEDSEAGQAVSCGSCGSAVVVPKTKTSAYSVIGDFVIEKEIGSGGLATVYLAHQLSLDRPAALKILKQEHASDPDYLENFLEEARAAAQLNHPNIVQAYAVGEDQGCHYFAMEYIEGTTLKYILAHSGRLVTTKAVAIATEIGKALEFAWQNKGLVHRDIKPDNIILTNDGTAKLADLGLAKTGKDFLQEDTDSPDVMGTPQYIAPELLLGKTVDNRADIYSLGATLYHVVTGNFPFEGSTATELARKHVTDPLVPPKKVVNEVPDPVSDIIEIMMAKRPKHRYQTAQNFLDDLEHYRNGEVLTKKPLSKYQKGIDLDNVDAELREEPDKASTEAEGKGEKEEGQKKAGGEKSTKVKSTSVGGTTTKKKGTKLKVSSSKKKEAAQKIRSEEGAGTEKTKEKPATEKSKKESADKSPTEQPDKKAEEKGSKTAEDAKEASGKTGASDNKSSTTKKPSTKKGARKKGKKGRKGKLSSKALARLLLAIGVGGVALLAVILILSVTKDDEPSEYPPQQAKALERVKRLVKQDAYYERILEEGKAVLGKFNDAAKLKAAVRSEIAPSLEKQIRKLRKEKHSSELQEWWKRARELQQQERMQQAKEDRRAMQERLEREEQLDKQQLAKQRQQLIEQLEKKQKQLRQKSIELCRKHEYNDADILFIGMTTASVERFRKWAEMKQKTIKLAKEAYKLVHDSGNALKGYKLSLKGKLQPAVITSINRNNINAEIREDIYRKGQFVRQKKEPLTLSLEDLSREKFFDLIKASAKRKDMSDDEIDKRIGAYLLTRGEEIDKALNLIQGAADEDFVRKVFEEADAIKEITKS